MKIYGNIFWKGKFVKGTLIIKENEIIDISNDRNYDMKGTVIPTMINMHTHIGDYACKDEPKGSLEEIVGPGGFKYRVLRNKNKVHRAMRRAMKYMEREGIGYFVDFREGGKEGADLLLDASYGMKIKPVIFARDVVPYAEGVGLSSVSDYDRDYILDMVHKSKLNDKKFAIHVSERIREDVDFVLSLNPSFIIHMLEATEEDLKKVAMAKVPVIVTPRSNLFFGKVPNIPRILKHGISVGLGTDNGMFSLPSLFREMEMAYKLSRLFGYVAPEDILKMVTIIPRNILGIDDNDIGKRASIVIFKRLMTPYEIVTRATSFDIKKIMF